ncbi:MAG: LysR family transcriptional regulator substrate-binding protein, partial [Desulfovibrio sp.]|uniref:LysR family transcriptional regulator substrate-binding protein n=1 Tax=Desulfovibrio sp. TaxID=885 RepID=UPI0025BA4640
SRQAQVSNDIAGWMGPGYERLNIVASYNLLYNAALMVEEGLGYALCLDKIAAVTPQGPLCFRPLAPRLEVGLAVAWKKEQTFSPAAAAFLDCLRREIECFSLPPTSCGSC